MNKIHTFLFCTSFFIFFGIHESFAQNDSLVYKERYGASFGVDLFKLTRTALDDNYSGFEINGDYRFKENLYLAGEIGNDQYTFDEENLVLILTGAISSWALT